ncbi:hypothetical protein K456DRAFT_52721 [Colletotrichum gloeosporioides 23]|nr:hypothetical protein K456DRAFT_52721 [Colletotrichum gloeosporioides 23]
MAGCGGLVTGGLLAGFLVGERITGVDPFNLTMFCWIIAGFIILVAKSIRVATWPWRDFLLGRVTTRSVSELASVTGLDEQYIILHLLSQQASLPLNIRGPYNSVFSWGEELDTGFSIDVQPTVRTLFASGIIVLEVLSSGGPALICIDLRPEMNRFKPLYMRKMKDWRHRRVSLLVCVDPPRGDDDDNILVFRYQRIRWERVIGVYNDEDGRVG